MTDDSLDSSDLSRALGEWARSASYGVRMGGRPGGFDSIQLHTRPDPRAPEVQLTLRAQLVDGRPVIVATRSPTRPAAPERSSVQVVGFGRLGDAARGPLGRDPDATCEGCGTTGTVGRAVRTGADETIVESHRFCAACWPEQSARYRARWEEEDRLREEAFHRGEAPGGVGHGTWFEAATWHGTLELVRSIERTMIAPMPPAPADLASLVEEIRAYAPELEGPMPLEVEMFVQRYGAPSITAPSPER